MNKGLLGISAKQIVFLTSLEGRSFYVLWPPCFLNLPTDRGKSKSQTVAFTSTGGSWCWLKWPLLSLEANWPPTGRHRWSNSAVNSPWITLRAFQKVVKPYLFASLIFASKRFSDQMRPSVRKLRLSRKPGWVSGQRSCWLSCSHSTSDVEPLSICASEWLELLYKNLSFPFNIVAWIVTKDERRVRFDTRRPLIHVVLKTSNQCTRYTIHASLFCVFFFSNLFSNNRFALWSELLLLLRSNSALQMKATPRSIGKVGRHRRMTASCLTRRDFRRNWEHWKDGFEKSPPGGRGERAGVWRDHCSEDVEEEKVSKKTALL